MFGKLENGKLERAPKSVVVEDRRIINPSAEVLKSLGYMEIEDTEAPATEEGYMAVPSYEKKDGKIKRKWSVAERPKEKDTTEERLNALEREVERLKELLNGGGKKNV